jgi:D-alanyl-D-alanine carboxypeptidase
VSGGSLLHTKCPHSFALPLKTVAPLLVGLACFIPGAGFAVSEPPLPPVNAVSAMVIDRDTGLVVGVKDPDTRRGMASTTKIMTALLAIEQSGTNIDQIVGPISANAAGTQGSRMTLQAGDRVSLRDLLYGLLLPSGNDAAVAIAEWVSGSESAFVTLMNQRAQSLGLTNTAYRRAFGYDPTEDPGNCYLPYSSQPNCGHYTTARDLAALARFAMNQSLFAQIVGTANWAPSTWVDSLGHQKIQTLTNTNLLLSSMPYSGANGIKTGESPSANWCMVASATRSNHSVLSVVLGSYDPNSTGNNFYSGSPNDIARHNDSIQLLEFGFAQLLGVQAFANGSFEQGLAGWTVTGHFDLTNWDVSDGSKVLRFNSGDQSPNAVVSQSFATTAGQSYILSFDYGIVSPMRQSQQRLEVMVVGNAVDLSSIVSQSAFNSIVQYFSQSFTFSADRSVTTLTFRDVSPMTNSVDSYLDNVQVKTTGGATPTPTPTSTFTPAIDYSTAVPRIGFQSVAGKSYRVEYTDNFTHGPWNVLENGLFTSNATFVQVSDPGGAGLARRFYRVAVEP